MPVLSAALFFTLLAFPLQPLTTVPGGFRILAEVDKELSSKKVNVGDTARFVCVQKIEAQDGTVLIPMGAHLLAKVVAVQKHRSGQQARISLRVETAKWPGGEAKLDAIVITIVSLGKTITTLGPASPATMNLPDASNKAKAGTDANYDIRTATRTIKGRAQSEGDKHAGDLSRASTRHIETVPAPVPDSWGLEKVDDPAIGSAITIDDGDVVLTKGSRVIFKTR